MKELIIAEKPSVALRLALSLGDSKPTRHFVNGVSYFELSKGNDTLFVVAAAGHLFTVAQKGSAASLPIFEVEWVPSYKISKNAYFTRKYLQVIEQVGKNCDLFVNACDYDIEGSVIGGNIIRYLLYGNPNKELDSGNVKRMHFSTTTKPDLVRSFANMESYDKGNYEAGATRHLLDWIWGINLSRALMHALSRVGKYRPLSIGRVQGPTLAILVNRDLEIRNFKPQDYWEVFATIGKAQFRNTKGRIFDEALAKQIAKSTKEAGNAKIEKVEKAETYIRPLPPFDLTSLQVAASNAFGIDPSKTLSIAQSLYERAYISYPRTSSQKLPRTLNLPRIIEELAKQEKFRERAEQLISKSKFTPAEGKKEDEAHPAIFPTGEVPRKLSAEEEKIYDLIASRFLSVFAEFAKVENTRIEASIGNETYDAKGQRIISPGWLSFYPYYTLKVTELQELEEGQILEIKKVNLKKSSTKPPERYTKASLIALLEEKNLGTKATRAEIIDTLFRRGYVKNAKIEVTSLGYSVYYSLSKYAPEIIDENLTRKLETDMDSIMHNTAKKEEVINEGKQIIEEAIDQFKSHEEEVGKALLEGVIESEKPVVLGKCPKCGGDLILKHSKNGKNYAICSNWPKCDVSYPLPGNATIVPTGKVCEICHTPIVKVFMRGKVFTMDLDPNCPSKKDWNKKEKGGAHEKK
ncbi:MAG: DNA topoisomerase I [Candidatus Micrarchaeia archaeon]